MKTKNRTDVRDLAIGERETPRTTAGRTPRRELLPAARVHHPDNAARPQSENGNVDPEADGTNLEVSDAGVTGDTGVTPAVTLARRRETGDDLQGRPEPVTGAGARGGYPARDNLIVTHLHLVRKVALKVRRSRHGRGARLEDLEADGKRGLVEAATRFDPTRGTLFSAFAKRRVRGAMIDGIRAQSPVGRRPYERLRALAARRPANTNGSERFASYPFSHAGTGAGLPDITDDGQTDARWNGRRMAQVPIAEDDRLEIALVEAVRGLPDLERQLVDQCYFKDKRLTAAGRAMGVGRSWTSRVLARGLRILGERLGEKALELLRERGLVGRRRVRAAPETETPGRPTGGGESPAPSASPGPPGGQGTYAGDGSEDRKAIDADNTGRGSS